MKKLFSTLLIAVLLFSAVPEAFASSCPRSDTGEHEWGPWNVKREATCSKAGEKTRACRNCREKETKKIAKTAHSYGSWKNTKDSTCTSEGERTRKCKVCGHKDTETLAKKNHTWGEWTVLSEPGEFAAGLKEHACTVCGTVKQQAVYPDGILKKGDKGDAVRELQTLLSENGYDCGKADGDFGKNTETAVKAFEAVIGIEQDGIAWPGLINKLRPQERVINLPLDGSTVKTAAARNLTEDEDTENCVILLYYEDETYEYVRRRGEPTYFDLPDTNADGEPIYWAAYSTDSWDMQNYTGSSYFYGMAFDVPSAVIAPRRIYGEVVKVTLDMDGRTIAEYHIEKGRSFPIPDFRAPYAILDDFYVEWYSEKNGKGKSIEKYGILNEDTTFYGYRMGLITELTLADEAHVFSYINGYPTYTLEAGTKVKVVRSVFKGGVKWNRIQFPCPDANEYTAPDYLGWIVEARFADTPEKPTIYLKPNGGTVETEFITEEDYADYYNEETGRLELPTPEYAHHTFKGWTCLDGESDTNQTYEAAWEPEARYKIIYFCYNYSDDFSYTSESVTVDAYATDYQLIHDPPKKYEFTGWLMTSYQGPDDPEPVEVNRPFTPGEPITGNIVIRAQYLDVEQYTVTFDMQVWDAQPDMTVWGNETDYQLPVPEEKDGYEFIGWCITRAKSNKPKARANVSVQKFTPGDRITANITLQAQYRQTKGFTITFDAGEDCRIEGMSSRINTGMTTPAGKLAAYPNVETSDRKLHFAGWYTADGKRVDDDSDYVFEKDTTLYAHYSHDVSVTINGN